MNVIRILWQTKKEPWFLKTIEDYGGHDRNVIWTPNLDEAMKFSTLNKAVDFFNMAQYLTGGQYGLPKDYCLRQSFCYT